MAMIPCRECGETISDGAPTCPKCGIPSPGGQARLEVRRASKLMGALVPLNVWIDNNDMGTISPGNSISLTVAPGVHRIECKLLQGATKGGAEEFHVPAGKHLTVNVSTSKWNGAPIFSAD